jgi:hypothetical protein
MRKYKPSTNGRRAKEKPPGVGGLSYFHFIPAALAIIARGSNNQIITLSPPPNAEARRQRYGVNIGVFAAILAACSLLNYGTNTGVFRLPFGFGCLFLL